MHQSNEGIVYARGMYRVFQNFWNKLSEHESKTTNVRVEEITINER